MVRYPWSRKTGGPDPDGEPNWDVGSDLETLIEIAWRSEWIRGDIGGIASRTRAFALPPRCLVSQEFA